MYLLAHSHFAENFRQHIRENLIQTRCPAGCNNFVADFDACAGLQCGRKATEVQVGVAYGCGAHFCAWCMEVCTTKDTCHDHVRKCVFNPTPGYLYPPQPHPQIWMGVMAEFARKRVKQYVAVQVPSALQERVYTEVRDEFPEIHLPLFGQRITDAFRVPEHRPKPSPTFEENITALMEMGLANRVRAIQVLEVFSNDLTQSTNFLLAQMGAP